MQALFQQREQQDVGRLHRVVALAEEDGCIVRRLLAYFGEPMGDDCGGVRAAAVRSRWRAALPVSGAPEIAPEEVELVHALVGEKHAALRTPRQLARFLCGISSPAATRARLGSHDAFAALAEIAFQDVLALTESLNDA